MTKENYTNLRYRLKKIKELKLLYTEYIQACKYGNSEMPYVLKGKISELAPYVGDILGAEDIGWIKIEPHPLLGGLKGKINVITRILDQNVVQSNIVLSHLDHAVHLYERRVEEDSGKYFNILYWKDLIMNLLRLIKH